MKQWISDRLLSIKHGAAYFRGIFSWQLGVLYCALILQWAVTPFVSVWHLLTMLVIVALIDCLSYSQGIKTEAGWNRNHRG